MKRVLSILSVLCVLQFIIWAVPPKAQAVHMPHAECCFDGDVGCCWDMILEMASGFQW